MQIDINNFFVAQVVSELYAKNTSFIISYKKGSYKRSRVIVFVSAIFSVRIFESTNFDNIQQESSVRFIACQFKALLFSDIY